MGTLPKINEDSTSYIKIDLPSGKKIGIKPWRVREEKELLFATEGMENIIDIKKEIVKFLGKCVDNTSLYDEMSEFDIIRIAMELRRNSKGDEIEYVYACPECGLKLEDVVSIKKHSVIKAFDDSPYKLNDTVTFTFKEPSFYKTLDIINKSEQSLIKYNYYYLINSIDSVTYNGETYTEFGEEDVIEFFDNLGVSEFNQTINELQKRSSVSKLEKKLTCIKCKHKMDVNFGDMLNFLAF